MDDGQAGATEGRGNDEKDARAWVREAFANAWWHERLEQQKLVPKLRDAHWLMAAAPGRVPFVGHRYAAVRAVLDWDHLLPSSHLVVRIFAAHTPEDAALLDKQLNERSVSITDDDLYPEFDLPDFASVETSETYLGVVELGSETISDLRFSSPWRRDVPEETAIAVLEAVNGSEAYKRACTARKNNALGPATVIGWAPPCIAHSDHWAIEVWLVTEFDGQTGQARVFLTDPVTMTVTREYSAMVQLG